MDQIEQIQLPADPGQSEEAQGTRVWRHDQFLGPGFDLARAAIMADDARVFPQPSGGEFGRTFVQVLFCFHMQSTVTRSDSLEAMSIVPAESEYPLAEGPGVFLWRFERSLAMGFEGRLADRIAVTQIDLHQLERLISSGCPPGTAYRILRP